MRRRRRGPYIHQRPEWPNVKWDDGALIESLGIIRNMQGKLLGRMEALGFQSKSDVNFETLTQDVLKSSEIEGELLRPDVVRSSVARKLGIENVKATPRDRNVDGVVEMMLDATQNFMAELTFDRLFAWHSSLFPSGTSGLYGIVVGTWRDDSTGPMQVVSGPMGRERVHYQAPPATSLDAEMRTFVAWFNQESGLDPVIKAALAHFWFITIHPFEDGNGRIARALTDMLLARADGSNLRFYSMSSQIQIDRKGYYDILEDTQTGPLDITLWMKWFLNCLKKSLEASNVTLQRVLLKHDFWNLHALTQLNLRQKLMLNRLFDGFEGKLTSSKWAKIAKCSSDTALRDIQDLLKKGILQKEAAGGRSTNYELVPLLEQQKASGLLY